MKTIVLIAVPRSTGAVPHQPLDARENPMKEESSQARLQETVETARMFFKGTASPVSARFRGAVKLLLF